MLNGTQNGPWRERYIEMRETCKRYAELESTSVIAVIEEPSAAEWNDVDTFLADETPEISAPNVMSIMICDTNDRYWYSANEGEHKRGKRDKKAFARFFTHITPTLSSMEFADWFASIFGSCPFASDQTSVPFTIKFPDNFRVSQQFKSVFHHTPNVTTVSRGDVQGNLKGYIKPNHGETKWEITLVGIFSGEFDECDEQFLPSVAQAPLQAQFMELIEGATTVQTTHFPWPST